MSRTASQIIGLIAIVVMSSLVEAAEQGGPVVLSTVAKVASVTARDSSGRARRFTDSRSHEFAVAYDEQGKVRSIGATRGPHIADVVWVGYAPDGRLSGLRLRTGYTLYFDNRSNGMQLIRDSQGGAVKRSGNAIEPIDGASPEQATKLVNTFMQIDSLFVALGQSTR